jgi:hypothetical protein
MRGGTFRVGFMGDIALSHDYDVMYSARGPHYPFELMKDVFKAHDVLIGNLEAPFCLGGETYPMKLSLRAHPGYAAGLKEAGFSVLTLGNNHILDYREQAFYETIEILDSSGLMRCGAGATLQEARRPALIEKNGITIGVLSCCDVVIDSPFYASDTMRGIAPLDMEGLEEDIRALRDKADIVIVSPHWGKEDWRYPHPGQVAQARRMIDCGAHLVVGHHPHVVQGLERYKHGYIGYSLGNFLFSDLDWKWLNLQGELMHSHRRQGRARRKTVVLSAEVTKSGVRGATMIACSIVRDLRVRPEAGRMLSRAVMDILSLPIGLKHYGELWARYDRLNTLSMALTENAGRLKNIHKLRPSHFSEMADLVHRVKSREPAQDR